MQGRQRLLSPGVGRGVTPHGSLMSIILQPWQMVLAILAGWINEQQQLRIEYLLTENQVLM